MHDYEVLHMFTRRLGSINLVYVLCIVEKRMAL